MSKDIYKNRAVYGSVKQATYEGCMKGMTAMEIAKSIGASPYTVRNAATRMKIKPRIVFFFKRKYKNGELKKTVIECYNRNMSATEISKKIECRRDEVVRIIKKHKADIGLN